MPFKERGAWPEASREYLNSLRPMNVQSERGVIGKATKRKYYHFIREAGEILGNPNPRSVTLEQMKALERSVGGTSERSVAVKCGRVRAFLRWTGNQAAMKWRISAHPRPYRGGVFLHERLVERLHQEARKHGPMEELIVSLGVDMGLRRVDMMRLTLTNAQNFLDVGEDEIIGKGRDGGKRALQMFSDYTRPLLLRYLEERRKLADGAEDRTGGKLLVIRVHRKRGDHLSTPKEARTDALCRSLSKDLGVRFTLHDLRRTCGNRMWRRGVPIETIAMVLRHEDCGVTFKAYIGVDSANMRDALMSLNPCPERASQFPAKW